MHTPTQNRRPRLSFWWLGLALLTACDDGSNDASPTPPTDAQVSADGAVDRSVSDADLPVDRGPMDATAVDAQARDAAPIDARTIDATLVDGALTDAAGQDAQPIDGAPVDATIDALPVDARPADALPVDAGAPACGDLRLPVDQIRGTEGLAIAADGTTWYSQTRAVGRWQPGGRAVNNWVALRDAGIVWGVAWRADDEMLFVASPSDGGVIYRIDTTAARPAAQVWHRNAGSPNGLIIGPMGRPYYTDFAGGHVYRLDGQNRATRITTSPIGSANGLLFDDDGSLLVLSYRAGRVFRLTFDAEGIEANRMPVIAVANAALDGIARDDAGRFYLSDNSGGRLLRYDANFGAEEVLLRNVPAAANIAFGRGALACDVVYVASSGTLGVFDPGE